MLQGHKEQVRCFSLLSDSPADARLLSWSFDGTVKVRLKHTHTLTTFPPKVRRSFSPRNYFLLQPLKIRTDI